MICVKVFDVRAVKWSAAEDDGARKAGDDQDYHER
jgi:hypothetical protein